MDDAAADRTPVVADQPAHEIAARNLNVQQFDFFDTALVAYPTEQANVILRLIVYEQTTYRMTVALENGDE